MREILTPFPFHHAGAPVQNPLYCQLLLMMPNATDFDAITDSWCQWLALIEVLAGQVMLLYHILMALFRNQVPGKANGAQARQIWTPFFAGWTPRLQWVHYVVLLKRGQPRERCGGRWWVVVVGWWGRNSPEFCPFSPLPGYSGAGEWIIGCWVNLYFPSAALGGSGINQK